MASNPEPQEEEKGQHRPTSKIPGERNGVRLTDSQREVYEILLQVVATRQISNAPKPRIVVITDLAKDYDDLAAMVILKELHRLGAIDLLGFIANLEPAAKRTRFGRGALDQLGLSKIRIAEGTSGFSEVGKKQDSKIRYRHKEENYEFKCPFMADENDPRLMKGEKLTGRLTGKDLLEELCSNAQTTGQKFTLLLISSLEDIHVFSRENKQRIQDSVSNIVLQGGYEISADGKLEPLESANNNRYDPAAARGFHTLISDLKISSTVYTKTAAIAATLDPAVFAELAQTGSEVGEHLWRVQKSQDLVFYANASQKDPNKRFRKDLDQRNFLKTRTNWFETHPERHTEFPVGEEISNFTKVVVYDALAAVGVSGDDALRDLRVLDIPSLGGTHAEPKEVKEAKDRHRVVGVEGVSTGIDAQRMVTVLSALLKGSLIESSSSEPKQPSTPGRGKRKLGEQSS